MFPLWDTDSEAARVWSGPAFRPPSFRGHLVLDVFCHPFCLLIVTKTETAKNQENLSVTLEETANIPVTAPQTQRLRPQSPQSPQKPPEAPRSPTPVFRTPPASLLCVTTAPLELTEEDVSDWWRPFCFGAERGVASRCSEVRQRRRAPPRR